MPSGPGIGKITAILFAEKGRATRVDRQLERAQETVAVMEAEGGTAFALEADVTKRDECEQMVATG